jgi:hypothetical protein
MGDPSGEGDAAPTVASPAGVDDRASQTCLRMSNGLCALADLSQSLVVAQAAVPSGRRLLRRCTEEP